MNIYDYEAKRVISIVFFIFLVTFTSILRASEATQCKESTSDVFDIFCEQTARHTALEIDWEVFNTASLAKDGFVTKQDAKETAIAELSLNNGIYKPEESSYKDNNIKYYGWPKPKILDRSYETALNFLDLDGQRDLRSCTLFELKNLSQVSDSLPKYQLEAMLDFSNAHLGAVATVEVNSTSDLNSKLCGQLLRLVLGRA